MNSLETQQRSAAAQRATFRKPDLDDGAALWRLAKESKALDLNSPYAYLMWAEHFAHSSVLAEVNGRPAGFLIGFRPPERPDVLFVWQVAVADEHRGIGLASRMLDALVQRMDASIVEATVTPSNQASQKLFRSFARRRGTTCRELPHITSDHFPEAGHEPEVLFHIGPFSSQA